MIEIKEMTVEELETRKVEIGEAIEQPDANLDELETEVRAINEEIEARRQAESRKAEIRTAVAKGDGDVIETIKDTTEERKIMDVKEIRNSKEYIDAYAEYIKSGDPAECRALISENTTNGTVPVPEMVYDIVKTAWQRDGIMSRVRRAYVQGNLKVGFEISGTDAVVHTEGSGAVTEETLTLGVVNLVPASIKKWISVSDEVIDLRGEAFLNYIYDELAYRIAKKAADTLVADIVALGTVSTTTAPGVPVVTATSIAMGTIASAIANLSDEAANPVVIMNKLTWSAFKQVQYAAGFAADPFEGLEVVFNDTLKAFSAASTGDAYVIVGDLDQGALANFPNGEDITFKYDDVSLSTSDLVKIIGRQFVALGVVAPNAFVKIVK